MRTLLLVLCFLGCAPANDELGDAGLSPDVPARTDVAEDVAENVPDVGCSEEARFVATNTVTQLEYLAPHLLVGTTTTLEARSATLELLASQEVSVLELSGAEGRVVAFDGRDARLFALSESGELAPSGRIGLAGDSALALRGPRFFTFRYPQAARINTMEARDLTELTEPVSLGEVNVAGTGPADLAVADNVAYALDAVDMRMTLIDVSDPENMQVGEILEIPEIAEESQVFVAGDGAFVGTAAGVAHVDLSTLSVVGSSEGGALVARAGERVATASPTQVFVYRLEGSALRQVTSFPALASPTALGWADDSLVVGSDEGLRIRPCTLR